MNGKYVYQYCMNICYRNLNNAMLFTEGINCYIELGSQTYCAMIK